MAGEILGLFMWPVTLLATLSHSLLNIYVFNYRLVLFSTGLAKLPTEEGSEYSSEALLFSWKEATVSAHSATDWSSYLSSVPGLETLRREGWKEREGEREGGEEPCDTWVSTQDLATACRLDKIYSDIIKSEHSSKKWGEAPGAHIPSYGSWWFLGKDSRFLLQAHW